VDRLSPQRRSWLMAQVKGYDTTAELRVRRAAHALGLRYRIHSRDLPGTPDLVFAKYRIVLFVHGCFWHRHPGCQKAGTPKSRIVYWVDKFERNVARDRRVASDLRAAGWRVAVVWECQTKNPSLLTRRLKRIFKIRSVRPRGVRRAQ
jgi:DNA mismatch endonuclease (patch repair protein)